MKELPDTLTIWGKSFSHRYDVGEGVHIFENGADYYHFKPWTFAQKGAATNASTILDEVTGELRIDTARFNEDMLMASLVKAQVNSNALEVSLSALQGLPVSLGDELLSLAQLVNGMATGEANPDGNRAEKPKLDSQSGTYCLKIGNDEYLFKEWTWGEKNKVTSQSLTYDVAKDRVQVNMAIFNELMLEATLVKAPFEITLSNIQKLSAPVGDALLQAVQQVNGITDTEKKSS